MKHHKSQKARGVLRDRLADRSAVRRLVRRIEPQGVVCIRRDRKLRKKLREVNELVEMVAAASGTRNQTQQVMAPKRGIIEAADVGRTERSVINCCQPNKKGAPAWKLFRPERTEVIDFSQSGKLAIPGEKTEAAQAVLQARFPYWVFRRVKINQENAWPRKSLSRNSPTRCARS